MALRLRWALGLAGGFCVLAGNATAQDGPVPEPPLAVPAVVTSIQPAPLPPTPGVITPPHWVRQPLAEFPELAMSLNVEQGRARLACVANVRSRLEDCKVLLEAPEGVGFAEAALAGVVYARVQPGTVDGTPVPSPVTFNVDFRMEPLPPPQD